MYGIRLMAMAIALLSLDEPAFAQPPERSLTYTRDIAPIVIAHCAPCHRPGEAAPFSLLGYADVRSRARLIAEVTARRQMPPWKPVAGHGGPFVGERRLTDDQIRAIARWVEQGAVEGDRADAPPLPAAVNGWRLGTPDLVVTLAEPYSLAADGPDEFRNFVVPLPTRELKYVAGVEFRPAPAVAIHHANLRIDATRSSRDLDADDPLPGYEGAVGVHARYPDGYFLGWTPGQLPPLAAKGMAWRLAPNSDLVLQLHLKKTGRVEQVQPAIAFYFTDDAPTALPLAMRLGRQSIDIPAGESSYRVRDSYTLPVDVELHALHPHAHYRARDVKVFADIAGERRLLLHIDDWDFNWQDVYRFVSPVALPAGTVIGMEIAYDNSDRNPRNPDRPPRRVIFGQNSSDEMGDVWMQVLPKSARDRARLYADFYPKTVAEDIAGYEKLLAANPGHAGFQTDIALLKWGTGRRDEAAAHFETAVRLNPKSASALYNLATVLAARGRLLDAADRFREALALRPDHAETHNNLGAVLTALGRLAEAVAHFRRATEIDPANLAAQENLRAALARVKK